ncbi:MAG: diguanylate cyclase [Acidobacteria bacterium]|nr:MAG: diguanylate cyclase [Acidobacteriota bacterium]
MSSSAASILIIDDVEQIRRLLGELLTDHECVFAASAEDAWSVLQTRVFDLVLSDINMPGMSGLDLVPQILERSPDTVVVMISGEPGIESAIEALRAGAFDYISKPIDILHVQAAVDRALGHHRLLADKRRYENHLEELVRERTAEIEHLAYYDRLTDLPNRNLFVDRCTQALGIAQRDQHQVGVVLVSLDRFKKIAESLSHEAGDVVLSEVANRLRSSIREGDTAAHLEGDEFVLLLTQVDDTDELTDVCLMVNEAMKQPINLGNQDVYMTVSIGIATFPTNGDDTSVILRNAGAALYRAKKQGGNNYQFYAADMNAQAVKRLALESSLRRAVENQEFITYYQPVVNLTSGDVLGSEALVRWEHPEFGILPPAKFIDLAEDTGLIVDIGDFVLRAACRQTREWQDDGLGRLRIAVNISARHFQQVGFVDRIMEVLLETRLDPACLDLELTETSIMDNAQKATAVLSDIRRLGVRVSIDDFGTGYSSLSYLKSLPIDNLKLDQSFVKGATTDPDDATLVMTIVTLSHNLRLNVVAEGVETDEQLAFLRLLRCDEGQGYLFGRPVPAATFRSTLAADPRRKLHVLANPRRSERPGIKVVKRKIRE